jgi:hypothetical protein
VAEGADRTHGLVQRRDREPAAEQVLRAEPEDDRHGDPSMVYFG